MIGPFFEAAGRSVSRQASFRQMVVAHVVIVAVAAAAVAFGIGRNPVMVLGMTMLLVAVFEGALILGWRLTQWPKSKALELVLISPLTPRWAMVGEQMVGLSLFGFIILSTAPILTFFVGLGWMTVTEAIVLPLIALTWGCITGLGLTWWAYEPRSVRKIGERLMLVGVLAYLVIGGLAAEQTFGLVQQYLPYSVSNALWWGVRILHEDTPFALIYRLSQGREPNLWRPWFGLQIIGVALALTFFVRSALRLRGHYIDRHYAPVADETGGRRGTIGDQPLAWHAVRRVSEYSGRVNLWLAIAVSILYAAFIIAGNRWPQWLGRGIFPAFEVLGGPAALASVLVLLAGVPAAYQYGLWDSSVPERCKKLELLLLTDLQVKDYLWASFKASWTRGRGYLFSAAVLIFAAGWAGRTSWTGAALGLLSCLILLGFFGAVGFRYLAQSTGSTVVGFLLSLGLPMVNWALGSVGRKDLASLLPPGLVYYSLTGNGFTWSMAIAAVATVIMTIVLLRNATRNFDGELRAWYDVNLGKR